MTQSVAGAISDLALHI